MNFLPFIFIMITCLALIIQSMYSQFRLAQIERKEAEHYFFALTNALDKATQDQFEELRPSPSKPSRQHKPSTKEPKCFARDHAYADGLSFLNLFVIAEDSTKKPFLKQVKNIFLFLYQELASEEDLSSLFDQVLSSLISDSKKEQKALLVSSYLNEQIPLESKIIHGTKSFYLDEKKGYPAIDDVFRWDPEMPHLGYFRHLSPVVLSLFLGEEKANLILTKERELTRSHPKNKPQTLNQKKTLELFEGKNFPLFEVLSFKDKKPKRATVGLDETNHPFLILPNG